MSRSFRKTPIAGITTASSEAWDKKNWHSIFRAVSKQNLNGCHDYGAFVDINFRSVSNPWKMAKDGKSRMNLNKNPNLKKYLRK